VALLVMLEAVLTWLHISSGLRIVLQSISSIEPRLSSDASPIEVHTRGISSTFAVRDAKRRDGSLEHREEGTLESAFHGLEFGRRTISMCRNIPKYTNSHIPIQILQSSPTWHHLLLAVQPETRP